MAVPALVLTRPQWRSHAVGLQGETLWVLGDKHCDEQLLGSLDQGVLTPYALQQVTGHFAAILQTSASVALIADAIRSFPLFYTVGGSSTSVCDDAMSIAGAAKNYEADYDSRLEFRHSGYVSGENTLYAGLKQVQAGETLTITAGGEISRQFYRTIQYSGRNIEENTALDKHFSDALDVSMQRFLKKADGRQVVVPLSGGLDSRLLSVHLKEAGYTNMVNYTYGSARTREVLISEEVAAALDQRWLFCQYDKEDIRSAWDAPETAEFIKFAHAGASLPHIQDWYAVRWLKSNRLVDQDAIFLPGHTIVGNMHDEQVLDAPNVPRQDIKKLLLDHHYSLQPDNGPIRVNKRLNAALDVFLDGISYDGSVVSRLTALESWNFRERQTKYINNSMRNYEHFGFDWALPMLDREVYLAWGDFHPDVTRNRNWYEGYVNRRYANATGTDLRTFAPTDISAGKRNAVKTVLSRTGLLRLAERTLAARAVQNHPMGFHWFTTAKNPKELYRFTRSGGNLLGAYADEFLTDTWNSHCKLFTEDSIVQ